jgi:hypothetical protein
MKIAFVHPENEYSTDLISELKRRLNNHEIVSWVENKNAPADDFEAVVVMGKFTQKEMARGADGQL